MSRASAFFVAGCLFALVAACVGGPGALPGQEPDSPSEASRGGSGGEQSGSTPTPSTGETSPKQPAVISVASYDTSCDVDEDCVAVFQGPACQACKCPNAAINEGDVGEYNDDLASAAKECADTDVACNPCPSMPPAACDPKTKRCALGVTSADAG